MKRGLKLGTRLTEEWKRNISKGHLGISSWSKGLSIETDSRLKAMAEKMRGSNNPNWKGGQNRPWCKQQRRDSNRKHVHEITMATIGVMGGKCSRCGFDDVRALQIDHVNGGGVKENRKIGTMGIRLKILKDPNWREKYQLLCANCNWIKRSQNNEIKSKPIEEGDD